MLDNLQKAIPNDEDEINAILEALLNIIEEIKNLEKGF